MSISKVMQDVIAANGMSPADFREKFEACIDKDATERPPQPGQRYRAFVVRPSKPGPQVLAIAHREGEMRILDLLRGDLTSAEVIELVKAYGIEQVTGATNDEDDKELHALAGVVSLL